MAGQSGNGGHTGGMLKPVHSTSGATGRKAVELLTCRVGEQWLGLQVVQVREVVSPQRCTPMPLADAAVVGLINLRGRVITQIDVRTVIGMQAADADSYRVAIVETQSGEDFGLLVDQVGEVIELDPDMYEKTPGNLHAIWQEVSEGVLKESERIIVLVDVERFIARTLSRPETQDDRALH